MALDANRARRDLDWTPRYSMDQGLDETVGWALARESG
jgi:nucleoside-diphosphate-sugar epimerase